MAEYFKLRSGLSRPDCTWLEHYYYRDATGRLAEVIICEDGFSHRRAANFK
jgi:hypothetical protein